MKGDRAESNRRRTDSQSVSGNQHRTRPQRKERDSNPQSRGALPASNRIPSPALPAGGRMCPSVSFSSSTRIRTWNLSLEARHDVRFTIEPCHSINIKRKAWDSNPHDPRGVARFSKPARQAVSGYLPYISVDPLGIEPGTDRPRMAGLVAPACRAGVFPLDHEPSY